MHWTAILAYRRFDPTAEVIGDVGCIKCGYNLRGLRVSGRCPECSQRVADSLQLLTHPNLVADSLRGISSSYLTTFAIMFACVGASWGFVLAMIIILLGVLYRTWCAFDLRLKAKLQNIVDVRSRSQWLAIAMLLEAFTAIGCLMAFLLLGSPGGLTLFASLEMGLILCIWLLSAVLGMFAVGMFNLALARVIAAGWIVAECRLQLVAVGLCGICTLFFMASVFTLAPGLALAVGGLAAVATAQAVVITWTSLHHVANEAEHQQDSWDELVERDAVGRPAGPTTSTSSSRRDHPMNTR